MKHRRKATICAVLMGIFLTGISYGANANEAGQAELSEIIDGESYIKINFGGGYIGKSAEYDILHRRTVVQPNDRENRTIIRSRNMLTVFYGKYRGKDEYKDYHEIFPELDADFFLSPMKKLRLTVSEIQENDYTIQITDKQQIENFLIPLSYIGALDNEIFVIESVEILFDEGCRPIEVRFALGSETAEPERTVYQENQLKQTYEYIEESVFEEHYSEIEREIDEIVPLEDVEIIDYIDELSNVVKIADEHFLLVLRGETKELEKVSGWDKTALFAYLEAVDDWFSRISHGYEGEQITQEEYLEQLSRIYRTAHLVGSDVYTYMFKKSRLSAEEKTLLVLRQMDCYMDSNDMLQMGDGDYFDSEMPPHSEFLEEYAKCVRKSYQKRNKKYRQLDNAMIHQFRMYIDRHNIEYVRKYFEGKNDYEKLVNYARAFEFELYYGEPSRHHNKVGKQEWFQGQEYDKILTPNRLSEFIVNVKTGEFVTEWDVLENDGGGVKSSSKSYKGKQKAMKKKLVDTESFNYAPAEYTEAHQKLDVLPATPAKEREGSLYLENNLKKKMKEKWRSPGIIEYREKYRNQEDYLS